MMTQWGRNMQLSEIFDKVVFDGYLSIPYFIVQQEGMYNFKIVNSGYHQQRPKISQMCSSYSLPLSCPRKQSFFFLSISLAWPSYCRRTSVLSFNTFSLFLLVCYIQGICSLSSTSSLSYTNVFNPQVTNVIYIYIHMEHPFLMFLDHTQRRSTVGRTPLDE